MPEKKAVQRLKGKQVKILYDLVTVSRECPSWCVSTATEKPGRRMDMAICESGYLPVVRNCYFEAVPKVQE